MQLYENLCEYLWPFKCSIDVTHVFLVAVAGFHRRQTAAWTHNCTSKSREESVMLLISFMLFAYGVALQDNAFDCESLPSWHIVGWFRQLFFFF